MVDDQRVLEALREVEAGDNRLSTFLARQEAELTVLWRAEDPRQHGNKELWEKRAAKLREQGYSNATAQGVRMAWSRLKGKRVAAARRAPSVAASAPTLSRPGFATMGPGR